MSVHQSNKRWKERGVLNPTEILRRAPGFSRYFYNARTGELEDHDNHNNNSDNQSSSSISDENQKLAKRLDESFVKTFGIGMFRCREDYDAALLCALDYVQKSTDDCNAWALNYLRVIQQEDQIWVQTNLISIEKDFSPDFVSLDEYWESDCNFNSNVGVDRIVGEDESSDEKEAWNRLKVLIWAAHICPDHCDISLSNYLSYGQSLNKPASKSCLQDNTAPKKVTDNQAGNPSIGRKMFILHLITSCPLFHDSMLKKAIRLCPRRGTRLSIHKYVDKYFPLRLSLLSLAAVASPISFENFDNSYLIARCIIEKLLKCSTSSAQDWIHTHKNDSKNCLLPFHSVILSGKSWKDGVSSLFAAYTNAMHVKEPIHHWAPLHCAAFGSETHPTVIETLLHLEPETASYRDKFQRLPLHIICENRPNDVGVQRIFCAYPEGAATHDGKGNRPNIVFNIDEEDGSNDTNMENNNATMEYSDSNHTRKISTESKEYNDYSMDFQVSPGYDCQSPTKYDEPYIPRVTSEVELATL